MNSIKSAIFSGHRSHPHVGAAAVPQQQLGSTASFHSTPILQRKHKTQWHNVNTDSTIIRDVGGTEKLKGQCYGTCQNMQSLSFRVGVMKMRKMLHLLGLHGGFEFCTSDEDEPENLFRNVFRDQHTYYWSFSSDNFQRNSKRARSQKSRNWSFETDEEDEVSAPSEVSLARQALGLSTSGPLKLEDVKSAYRACALRWHPDRHNGSSKVLTQHAQGTTVW
ncbi:Chaperone DnaJ-domain superfamily protein [Zea mays]|uniref:Chaperone DnaJ-domain superfamily protein n=1 Tax=Zea mays TaxID=4577 RepID=A0A1D6IAD7_MAIZE|nr:Chaperone DnaJ-domain superfamily protein [Zea mays]